MTTRLSSDHKTIGILGGMGPAASADLYYKIIHLAQTKFKAEQDTDFPPMIIFNLPLYGFDETGFVNPEHVKEQLCAGVRRLEAAGAELIIIACNTVHYFYEDMQAAIKVPIFNIMTETANKVKISRLTKVGVVSSESTKVLNLYPKAFEPDSIAVVPVTEYEQKQLNQIILHVMAGHQNPHDAEILQQIAERMRDEGAEGIVLGCTELPLAARSYNLGLPTFDTTTIIAEAALHHAYTNSYSM